CRSRTTTASNCLPAMPSTKYPAQSSSISASPPTKAPLTSRTTSSITPVPTPSVRSHCPRTNTPTSRNSPASSQPTKNETLCSRNSKNLKQSNCSRNTDAVTKGTKSN